MGHAYWKKVVEKLAPEKLATGEVEKKVPTEVVIMEEDFQLSFSFQAGGKTKNLPGVGVMANVAGIR
jgi:hypothetical protein